MLRAMAGLTLLLTFADHWTTYLCLRAPIAGWDVVEANPLADWLFDTAGLSTGLLIDTAVTLVAVGFLVSTSRMRPALKLSLLTAITLTTGFAVANNLHAIQSLGLSPLGWG